MNEFENAVIAQAKELLSSARWDNPDSPGSAHVKELGEYIRDGEKYRAFGKSEVGSYYLAIIEPLEWLFNDDWLPYKILGLDLLKAREFLKHVVEEVEQHGLEPAIPLLRRHYSRLENEP